MAFGYHGRWTPTRFTQGVSTEPRLDAFGNLSVPSPVRNDLFVDDFNVYNAANYTVTTSGATAGTAAGTNFNGGAVLLTAGVVAAAQTALRLPFNSFGFTPGTGTVTGLRTYFRIRFSASDATTPTIFAGLTSTAATATITDGIYLSKAAGSTTLNVINVVGGTVINTIALPTALANGVMRDICIEYSGAGGSIMVFDSAQADTLHPEYFTGLAGTARGVTSVTTALVTPVVSITAAGTTGPSLTVDYLVAIGER